MSENKEEPENDAEGGAISNRLLTLLFLGLGIVVIGIVIITVALVLSGGSGSVGGVIFIGPFPIVFGAGPNAMWLIIVSIIVAILMFVLLFLLRRRKSPKSND